MIFDTNFFKTFWCKDSGNLSSQYYLGHIHGEYLNIVPQYQMLLKWYLI